MGALVTEFFTNYRKIVGRVGIFLAYSQSARKLPIDFGHKYLDSIMGTMSWKCNKKWGILMSTICLEVLIFSTPKYSLIVHKLPPVPPFSSTKWLGLL